MTLVEVLIVTSIMGFLMLAMMTMQTNQTKSNNFLEFQLKRTELQGAIVGQFLNDPSNCACLFAGSALIPTNPALPGAVLSVSPTSIGPYNFVTPGNCLTATMPAPLLTNVGFNGLKTASIRLKDIINSSGNYSGNLVVSVKSTKDVLGPDTIPFTIRVSVATVPAGANVQFKSCSMIAAGGPVFIPKRKSCLNNYNKLWSAQFTNNECAPATCSAGETNVYQGCQLAGDNLNWTSVTCNRLCYPGTLPSGFLLEYFCPFGLPDGTPIQIACTPNVCPAATTDAGINCLAQRTGTNLIGGFCKRTCIAN